MSPDHRYLALRHLPILPVPISLCADDAQALSEAPGPPPFFTTLPSLARLLAGGSVHRKERNKDWSNQGEEDIRKDRAKHQ